MYENVKNGYREFDHTGTLTFQIVTKLLNQGEPCRQYCGVCRNSQELSFLKSDKKVCKPPKFSVSKKLPIMFK